MDLPIQVPPSRKQVIILFDELQKIIVSREWKELKNLIGELWDHTKNRITVYPAHSTITLNICLRVLKIVREEALRIIQGGSADFEENSTNALFAIGDTSYESVRRDDILEPILNTLEEFKLELKSCSESISELSLGFIHSDEFILTIGYSNLVLQFLRRAAKKNRRFKVAVSECYPWNSGHRMASELSKDGVSVILIPDSHAFALMSRVNKVIINCQAVYSDGRLKVATGTTGIIFAAVRFSVPVYVCLPQYKISPIPLKPISSTCLPMVLPVSSPSSTSAHWLSSPRHILPLEDYVVESAGLWNSTRTEGPVVWSPNWEYVPAGLVSLFLTNLGCHAPSYLYALVRELFHSSDITEAKTWE